MFDFAISRYQRRRPTSRLFAAWTVSGLGHLCLLLLLIQYPQLLRGGMYHRFRPISALANLFGSPSEDDDKNWRTVAVLRSPMVEPSAATIKKYLKDWGKTGPGTPPIRIRWGDEQRKALENAPPMPRIKQEPKATTVLPPPSESAAAGSQAGNSTEASQGSSTAGQTDLNAGNRGPGNLPSPGAPAKPEVASNNPPGSIPSGVKQPSTATPSSKESVKVFENEQKAIQSPESGFFNVPQGFPLDDYVYIIKERIKGNWFIPSHLKNSQGHTTIIFYIGKDGRFSNARIEASASSGNASLDLAALKAIMDSNPFPPLPKGFPGDRLGAKFVLSYNEPQ
jgi:TonB family protein